MFQKNYTLLFVMMILLLSSCSLAHNEKKFIEPGTNAYQVYEWLVSMQLENGLLESAEDSNFVSLYDNALAAILFTELGDYERSEKIFNFFESRLDVEFYSGPGGFGQFRDREGVPLNNSPHRWLGDNAWLLIALNHYHVKKGNEKYQDLAFEIESWMRSLQDDDGGLWGGYDRNGNLIPKNTEGIIDAFNAVKGYDDFHQNILLFLKNYRWDSENKRLVTGDPMYYSALDLYSWSISMLEDYPLNSLYQANALLIEIQPTGKSEAVRGYSFDKDLDTIWVEGTAQMAVAFQIASLDERADAIIIEIEKLFIFSSKNQKTIGLPYVSNNGTGFGSGELWLGADTKPAVSSSVWYLFAKLQIDPFRIGREKNIPIDDQFYQN